MKFDEIVENYYNDTNNFYNSIAESDQLEVILTDDHSLDNYILGLALNKMLEDNVFGEEALNVIEQYIYIAMDELAESVLEIED